MAQFSVGGNTVVLSLLMLLRSKASTRAGDWPSAVALFIYAGAFSYAYVDLPTGIGALLLFASVQVTMVGGGLWQGERLGVYQVAGMAGAMAGLVALLVPPRDAWPAAPLGAAALMLLAGLAWGAYSLRGRHSMDPASATRGNFVRTLPLAVGLLLIAMPSLRPDTSGLVLAVASGGIASSLGYIIWYMVMPCLPATRAATVQLSVPLIAAAVGALLLGETMTTGQLLAAAAIVGGIWVSLLR